MLLSEAVTAVLIGGAPRSGTTLLCDLLNEQSEIGIFSEFYLGDFLGRLDPLFDYEAEVEVFTSAANEGLGVDAQAADVGDGPRLFRPLDQAGRIRHWRRYPQRRDVARIATAVARASLDKPKLHIIGSKYPLFFDLYHPGRVESVFPDTRMIFVLRRPLDVINSSINRRNMTSAGLDNWHVPDVLQSTEEYLKSISNIVSMSAALPGRVLCLKYEDMVSDEPMVCSVLEDFLGIAVAPTNFPAPHPERQIVLTEEESALIPRTLVEYSALWNDLALTGPGETVIPALAGLLPAVSEERGWRHDRDRSVLAFGWSPAEADGVWSEKAWASLAFRTDLTERALVGLCIDPFLPTPEGRSIRIALNDEVLFEGRFVSGHYDFTRLEGHEPVRVATSGQPIQMWLGPASFRPDAVQHLVFSIEDAQPGTTYGLADPRLLGVKLSALQLVSLAGPTASKKESGRARFESKGFPSPELRARELLQRG
jgi:hypothetical protein